MSWIRGSYQSETDRRSAVRKLLPHIRFFCLSGEYLERLRANPEMRLPATQVLIYKALQYQAYSDTKKAELNLRTACQRKGVQSVHLEINSGFVLDERGTKRFSRSALWFGKRWYLALERVGDPVPTVGVFLRCKAAPDHDASGSAVDDVEAKFYTKIWPEGIWKFCGNAGRKAFCVEGKEGTVSGWGYPDALNMSWEEARRSERFLGSTGLISIMVIARRFRSSKGPQ